MVRARFAAVQVIGGLSVLGSYAIGARDWPNQLAGLWGAIPESVIPVYTLCMIPAAIGYLVTMGWAWSQEALLDRLTGWFVAFLGASSLWMPLSLAAVASGDQRLWLWVQVDLLITAVATLAIGLLLREGTPGRGRRWAQWGWGFLAWQTIVLDAVIWPRFFLV
jgi:hypothetical protein